MPCLINYNNEYNIIETVFSGIVVYEDIIQMFYDIREVAAANNCYLWLHDFSGAERRMTTMEVFQLPKKFSEIFKETNLNLYAIKRAIVGAKDMPDFLFASNVSYNIGLYLEAFDSREAGIKWLKSLGDKNSRPALKYASRY